VVVADSGFAVLNLLWRLRQMKNPICMIPHFRLDTALYEPMQENIVGMAQALNIAIK